MSVGCRRWLLFVNLFVCLFVGLHLQWCLHWHFSYLSFVSVFSASLKWVQVWLRVSECVHVCVDACMFSCWVGTACPVLWVLIPSSPGELMVALFSTLFMVTGALGSSRTAWCALVLFHMTQRGFRWLHDTWVPWGDGCVCQRCKEYLKLSYFLQFIPVWGFIRMTWGTQKKGHKKQSNFFQVSRSVGLSLFKV